jgi:hypothetical protein
MQRFPQEYKTNKRRKMEVILCGPALLDKTEKEVTILAKENGERRSITSPLLVTLKPHPTSLPPSLLPSLQCSLLITPNRLLSAITMVTETAPP